MCQWNSYTSSIISLMQKLNFLFQILPIPELFPFRLTGQMLNLLQPMRDATPYKQYMMGIMQAFRKHSGLLLNIMDVFVHEPLLDWQVRFSVPMCFRLCHEMTYIYHVLFLSARTKKVKPSSIIERITSWRNLFSQSGLFYTSRSFSFVNMITYNVLFFRNLRKLNRKRLISVKKRVRIPIFNRTLFLPMTS